MSSTWFGYQVERHVEGSVTIWSLPIASQ